MNIVGSKQYGATDWLVVSQTTPSFTLNALFKPVNRPIAFGVKGALSEHFVQEMVAFLDNYDDVANSKEGITIAPASIGAFDACAFLAGAERKFMRGWAEQEHDITHAFPIFTCELDGHGHLPPFNKFSRSVDVFYPMRPPEPYFTFKMLGGASKLRVDSWSPEKYSTLKVFIDVLSNERNSRLDVLNRHGAALSLSESTGWSDAHEKVHAHLVP